MGDLREQLPCFVLAVLILFLTGFRCELGKWILVKYCIVVLNCVHARDGREENIYFSSDF